MVYIFDMDGTLIDSMPVFGGAILKFLDEANVSYPSDIIKILTPLGLRGTVDYIKDKLGVQMTDEAIFGALGENMLDGYLYTIPAKEGVRERLSELKADGHTLAVLTASPHLTLDPCLKRLGLYDIFTRVWSSDDFGKTKADPTIYLDALELLGALPSECIFIDDNTVAVSAAKAAGLHAYGIYDKSASDFEDEMRRIAERYIMSFAEL